MKPQYDNPMRVDAVTQRTRPTKTTKTTTTRTERSTGGLGALSAGSTTSNGELAWEDPNESPKNVAVNTPTLVDEDLYALPSDLQPTYRPLDWFAQVLVAGVMGNIALIWDGTLKSQKIRNVFHLMFSRGPVYTLTEIMLQFQRASWSTTWQWIRWLVGFLIRCTMLSTFTVMVLQDIFLRPSRISTGKLEKDYFLPSTLSQFDQVAVQKGTESASVDLHWLEYRNDDNVGAQRRILYCNHGFGASSLSWLPCLKKMTQRLGCHVGLAHDALGFGFSEVNDDASSANEDPLYWYSFPGSAHLANSLLQKHSLGQNDTVVLVGHSMGALTTLRLALELPKETEKRIILVAPAFGLRQPPGARKSAGRTAKTPGVVKFARTWLLERPFQYVLRRAVGRPGFWRKGLQLVWGDANRLKDSDVLRFQWPAVHRGWEVGLVRFARAQAKAFSDDDLSSIPDEELLIRVLALPNTEVEVVLSEKDRVVNPLRSRSFFEPFSSITVQELAGVGHDPFEEDVDAFLCAIE